MSRGCYADATRKTASVAFKLYRTEENVRLVYDLRRVYIINERSRRLFAAYSTLDTTVCIRCGFIAGDEHRGPRFRAKAKRQSKRNDRRHDRFYKRQR